MKNKLGLDDESLELFEAKTFEVKSSLLTDKVTFNTNGFNLEYLIKLHDYLFGDLYYDCDKLSSRIDNESEIEAKIEELIDMISYASDVEYIKIALDELIDMQIFDDGNNRTISTFFKIIAKSYCKDKDYYEELIKCASKNHKM